MAVVGGAPVFDVPVPSLQSSREGVDPWRGRLYAWDGRVWRVLARSAPFRHGPQRHVLIECVAGGERVVRPFRGLTRAVSGA